MMIGAETTDGPRGDADDRPWLAIPHALAVGPGSNVQRVLQDCRHRAVVLRSHEQDCVSGLDPRSEFRPGWRGLSLIVILVVEGQVSDFMDFKLQGFGRKRYQCLGHLEIACLLAQAAHENRYLAFRSHGENSFLVGS